MPGNEFYRLDLVVSTTGEEQVKKKLQALDKFIEHTRKRGEALNRMQVNPSVRLIDRISAPLRTIERNLGRLKTVKKITIEAIDKVSDVAKRIGRTLTSPLVMFGAGAGATAAIAFPLRLAGEMDRARRSIELYSGSVEAGRKNFEELVNLAIKSPLYEVPFVVKQAGQLLAAGQDINFVKRALTAFGNAAMYTGASLEQLELAFYGFRQIASVGTLSMEELRQVTENLNLSMAWVAEELGVSGDELRELGKQGIPAKQAMEAIIRTLEKRFPVRDFNNDLLALVSNVKETARTVVWDFGEGMAQPVIRILQDMTGVLDPTSEKFKEFRQKVEDAGRRVGEKFEEMYQKTKKFFAGLSADPEFQKMDFGDKIIYIISKGLDAVIKWLDGEGGKKVQDVFVKLGEVAGRAWLAGLEGFLKGAVKSAAGGNILGSLVMLAGFGLLGGGALLRGGWQVLKGLGKGASWLSKTKPVSKMGESLRTLFFGEDILKSGKTATPAQATRVAKQTAKVAEVAKTAMTAEDVASSVSKISRLSKVSRVVGRIALPLAIAGDVVEFATSRNKVRAGIQIASGWGGLAGGAKLGAVIGTAVAPGIGTAIGAGLGGLVGYFGGRWAGGKIAERVQRPATATAGAGADMRAYLDQNIYQAFREYVNRAESWGRNLIRNFMRGRDSAGMSMGGWLNTKVYEPFRSIINRATSWGRNLVRNFIVGMQQIEVPPITVTRTIKTVYVTSKAGEKTFKKHAMGGIVSRPHLGLVAEAGPEVIIPLSSRLRSRALALWKQAGEYLGVKLYELGGIAGPVPAVAGIGNAGTINVTVAGLTVNMSGAEVDENALALKIGHHVLREIKKALENRL